MIKSIELPARPVLQSDKIVSKLDSLPVGQYSSIQEAYAKGESDFISFIFSSGADETKYDILKNTFGPGRQLIDKVYTFGNKNDLLGTYAVGIILP